MRAAIPPVAPASSLDGGAPHFSAQLGAWVRPLRTVERPLSRSRSRRRRPGNLSLADKAKWFVCVCFWQAVLWGGVIALGAWVWASYYGAGR